MPHQDGLLHVFTIPDGETVKYPTNRPPTVVVEPEPQGKGKSGSFLDPFTKWPRKDAQSKGIKQSWSRRFKRKPGRRGAPAIAGKKIYAQR